MRFVETDNGWISERYIIRLRKRAEDRWSVTFAEGREVHSATATDAAVLRLGLSQEEDAGTVPIEA